MVSLLYDMRPEAFIILFFVKKTISYIGRRLIRLLFAFFNFENEKLEDILQYCSGNIRQYKGGDRQIGNYDIIDKFTVMKNNRSFMKNRFLFSKPGYTSGTTGTPAKYLRDVRSITAEQYFQERYFDWKGKYKVVFRGDKLFDSKHSSPRIYKIVPFSNTMHVSSFHINDRTLADLVGKLQTIKNKCLWAYPSSAYMLAAYCIRNDISLPFEFVVTSSEMLNDFQIEAFKKAFDCPVKDWYGQAERVVALYRCPSGNYHEVAGYSHLEYLPVNEGQYELVGTSLHNRLMPLVRFNTHDMVEVTDEKCACGNPGKNITRIIGRSAASYVELPDGNRLNETTLSLLLRKVRNIVESQVVQTLSGSIIIRIVKSDAFTHKDAKELQEYIGDYLPEGIYSIEYVDRIERDASGKYRFVINENTK